MRCNGKKCIGSAYRKETTNEYNEREAKDALAKVLEKRRAEESAFIRPQLLAELNLVSHSSLQLAGDRQISGTR